MFHCLISIILILKYFNIFVSIKARSLKDKSTLRNIYISF